MKMAWIGGAAVAVLAAGALTLAFGTGRGPEVEQAKGAAEGQKEKDKGKTMKTATFGAGCFWCVEAVYQELKGVKKVVSGYAGGTVKNPTYQQVCTGTTGHAEVAQITYDPEVITYPELLEVFWKTHDPTTLNRQGADSGTQYRSVIFYHDDEQKKLAEEYKAKLDASGAFNSPIVTQIAKLPEFYPAEDYHQNYYRSNPNQGYCQFVIVPKLEKFRKVFQDKLQK
jgi:peptide-methionine (S)-S-oxide reductase